VKLTNNAIDFYQTNARDRERIRRRGSTTERIMVGRLRMGKKKIMED